MKSFIKACICLLVLLGGSCLAASAEEGQVILKAVVPQTHTVSVAYHTGGSFYLSDGTKIDNQFSVAHMRNITVRIVPDKGYKIESVFIDEQDVTDLVDKNGCLLLSNVYKSGNLRATFRFIRQDPEPNVPTGGRLPVAAAFLLLAGSGALAVAAGMKYRKQCS